LAVAEEMNARDRSVFVEHAVCRRAGFGYRPDRDVVRRAVDQHGWLRGMRSNSSGSTALIAAIAWKRGA
jgi:hypothetical protein